MHLSFISHASKHVNLKTFDLMEIPEINSSLRAEFADDAILI
jgi:hypothetical protein